MNAGHIAPRNGLASNVYIIIPNSVGTTIANRNGTIEPRWNKRPPGLLKSMNHFQEHHENGMFPKDELWKVPHHANMRMNGVSDKVNWNVPKKVPGIIQGEKDYIRVGDFLQPAGKD